MATILIDKEVIFWTWLTDGEAILKEGVQGKDLCSDRDRAHCDVRKRCPLSFCREEIRENIYSLCDRYSVKVKVEKLGKGESANEQH